MQIDASRYLSPQALRVTPCSLSLDPTVADLTPLCVNWRLYYFWLSRIFAKVVYRAVIDFAQNSHDFIDKWVGAWSGCTQLGSEVSDEAALHQLFRYGTYCSLNTMWVTHTVENINKIFVTFLRCAFVDKNWLKRQNSWDNFVHENCPYTKAPNLCRLFREWFDPFCP